MNLLHLFFYEFAIGLETIEHEADVDSKHLHKSQVGPAA